MDRKQFLKACTGGLCACAAAALPGAAADAPAKPDDWRLGFVKQRWARMLAILSQKMDPPALVSALEDMGSFCASQGDEKIRKFAGNVDGFRDEVQKNPAMSIVRDGARYTQSYRPGGDCFCPFNSLAAKTPDVMCNCSVGWAKHNWAIVLGKPVNVALKDSVLRGGKACTFEITPA